MPFKNPEDMRAWRKANRDKQKAYEAKHYAMKEALGLSVTDPIDPILREERQAQKVRAQARAAEYVAALKASAELYEPAKRAKRRASERAYRLRLRAAAIERLGGACDWCGYDEPDALEFDHIEPLLRKTNARERKHDADRQLRSIVNGELDGKIQLLCACCHTLKTRADIEHEAALRRAEDAILERVEYARPTLH